MIRKTNDTIRINVRILEETFDAIKQYMLGRELTSLSEAIRELIELGLETKKKGGD
jgi:hypothetical protein